MNEPDAHVILELEKDPMIGKLVTMLPDEQGVVYLFAKWTARASDVWEAYNHREASRTSKRRDIDPTTDTRTGR